MMVTRSAAPDPSWTSYTPPQGTQSSPAETWGRRGRGAWKVEDEELEGVGGGGVGEESLFVVRHFLRSRCVFSLGLSLLLFFGGEEGQAGAG